MHSGRALCKDEKMSQSFWFKSPELKVMPGEDEETNPFRFGKSVANWIATELENNGFDTFVCPEDWGWRIDCLDEPCPIWIGCGNMDEDDGNGNLKEPDVNDLTWQFFVEADKPFFKSLFEKVDASKEIEIVSKALAGLLQNTSHITLVKEP
jgi:hypothetical protein